MVNIKYFLSLLFVEVVCLMNPAFSQTNHQPAFCIELNAGYQNSFGPYSSRAEIIGGIDTLSFDNKKHFNPGYKSNGVAEFVWGYTKKNYQLKCGLSYFKKDIGLIQNLSSNEYSFVLSNMLSIKVSALLHLTNKEDPKPYGLFTGFFISSVFPFSNKMNDQTQSDFGIKEFQSSAQFSWGMDLNYSIRITDKGWYAITGITGTLPGLIGGIGKIELQPYSSYSIVRDKFQMYYMSAFLGIGKRFEK